MNSSVSQHIEFPATQMNKSQVTVLPCTSVRKTSIREKQSVYIVFIVFFFKMALIRVKESNAMTTNE